MRSRPRSIVLAIDPGLAAVGYILARVWPGSTWDVEVYAGDVLHAELPPTDERFLDVNDETTKRAIMQVRRVIEIIRDEGVTVVVAETISHPRDAGTALKVMAFWTLLVYVLDEQGLPFVKLRPQDIRQALKLPKTKRTMTRDQKKKLVHDALLALYGADKLKALLGHLSRKEDRSHPLDALASFTAVMSNQFGSNGFTLR